MILEHVQDVLSCPSAHRWSSDDNKDTIEEINPSHIYYLCPGGFFLFIPKSRVEYDSHVAFKRSAWGNTLERGFDAINYMSRFCKKLTCEIPEDNNLALSYAKKLGFVEEGINKQSFLRGGILINKIHLGRRV